MYVIREVLHCKPGKVRQMAEKFRAISHALQELGHEPMRLLTDVTGEPFWTIVAEAKVEKIDDFFPCRHCAGHILDGGCQTRRGRISHSDTKTAIRASREIAKRRRKRQL